MNVFQWRLSGRCHKFGHNIPHLNDVIPEWMINGRYFNPEDLIPHLFEAIAPGFHERARPGDIIVTGRNFGMGPKMNGYIAMEALGLGLVCESMPFLAYRAALGCGLKTLNDCPGVTDMAEDGDLLEVDFAAGTFINRTQETKIRFAPVPKRLCNLLERGGTKGWLRYWWETEGRKKA